MNIDYDYCSDSKIKQIPKSINHRFIDIDFENSIPFMLILVMGICIGITITKIGEEYGAFLVGSVFVASAMIGCQFYQKRKRHWLNSYPSRTDVNLVKKLIEELSDNLDRDQVRSLLNSKVLTNKSLAELAEYLNKAANENFRNTIIDLAREL